MVKYLTKLGYVGLILLVVCVCLAPMPASAAQTAEGFVTSWLLLGEYNTSYGSDPDQNARQDFLTDGSVTETNIIPSDGLVVNTDYAIAASNSLFGGGTPTVSAHVDTDDTIDYSAIYGDHSNVIVYAFTYANNLTGSPLDCWFGVSSDDSVMVLLNGEEMSVHTQGRGYGGANNVQDAYPITLRPGLNLFAVKTWEGGGGFGFRFRLQTDGALGTGGAANAIPDTTVSFDTVPGGYTYPPHMGTVYVETGGKVVLEAESFSWNNSNSNNWEHIRQWLLDSRSGSWPTHNRTSQTDWDTFKLTNGGYSGDFIYSGNPDQDAENNNRKNGGGDDGPDRACGVGWLIKFETPGQYYAYARELDMAGGNSNRSKFQFDWLPETDNFSGQQSWGTGDQDWRYEWGREGRQAIHVPRAGTYWLRLYHDETEAAYDQITLLQSATIPALPANTFIDVESTSLPITAEGRVEREITAPNYQPGGAVVPVTLTLTARNAGTIVTTDTLSPGWTIINVVASDGSTPDTSVPGQIVWTAVVAAGAVETCTYEAVPGASACGTAKWVGAYGDSSSPAGFPVWPSVTGRVSTMVNDVTQSPNDVVPQAELGSDGWANAPEPWQGTGHTGVIDPGAPVDTLWFACSPPSGRYEIIGSGEDIWGSQDEMQMLYMYMDLDGVTGTVEIEAVLDWDRPPRQRDFWAKGGFGIRDNLSAGSPYYGVTMRRDGRITRQHRDNQNGGSGSRDCGGPQNRLDPAWVKIRLAETDPTGSTFTLSYDSFEGATGTDWDTRFMPNIKPPVVVALYSTAHRPDAEQSVARIQIWNVVTTGSVAAAPSALGVNRTLPLSFAAGGQFTATLTVVPTGTAGAWVRTTETLPAGYSATPGVPTLGSAVWDAPNNAIIWDIPVMSATAETLDYDVTVPGGICRTNVVINNGEYFDGLKAGGTVAGDTTISWVGYDIATEQAVGQDDDGLAATGLPITQIDIGPGLDHPGAGLFYTCDSTFVQHSFGADIWGGGDEMHFIYGLVVGDFTISANTDILRSVNDWTKAGVMCRDNLTPGSPNAFTLMRGVDRQIRPQSRSDQDGGSQNFSDLNVANNTSAVLSLSRAGTVFTYGYDNLEGDANAAWNTADLPNISPACYVGLALTSHNSPDYATVQYQDVSLLATPYTPTRGTITRVFGDPTVTLGVPLQVQIVLQHVADSASMMIVENVPAGSLTQNISNGGVRSGDTITWNLGAFAAPGATVSYELIGQWQGNYAPLAFAGGYTNDEFDFPMPIPDSSILQTGTVEAFQQGVYPADTYAGAQDTHVIINNTDNNIGGNNELEEGHWGAVEADHKKILVQFDLTGATATSADFDLAQLCLFYERDRSGAMPLRTIRPQSILKSWSQGAGTGIDGRGALDGEVTWNNAVHGAAAVPWDIPGLMASTDVSDFEGAGATFGPASTLNRFIGMDVTVSTKGFLDTPASNNGWKVSQDKVRDVPDTDPTNPYTSSNGAADFWSGESALYDSYTGLQQKPVQSPVLVLLDDGRASPAMTVARSFSTPTFEWGNPLAVFLDLTHLTDSLSVRVVEDLPDGVTSAAISNVSVPGNLTDTQIIWDLTNFTANVQVSYQVNVTSDVLVSQVSYAPRWFDVFLPLRFPGATAQDAAGFIATSGESRILHTGTYVFQENTYGGAAPDAAYDGCQDTHIIVFAPDGNAGATPIMEEGDWSGGSTDHKKLLMQFDVSSVPATDVIVDARLRIYSTWQERATLPANESHFLVPWQVLRAWNQGRGNDRNTEPAIGDEVTWNDANTAGVGVLDPWEYAGATGRTDVGTSGPATWWDVAVFPGQTLGEWVDLDVTQMVADIVAGTAVNNGWKVCQDTLSGVVDSDPNNGDPLNMGAGYKAGAYQFATSENANVDQRPLLIIRTDLAVPVEVSTFMLY